MVSAATAIVVGLIMAAALAPAPSETMPTAMIDADHPAIVAAAREAVGEAREAREKAVRIHDFVRDRIRFGWDHRFYAMTASEVLKAGVGFCNTKSTLFTAMLRAAGIPARQHFADIDVALLAGLVDPRTPYVDHSYTEVYLDGRWLKVDSYIVDRPLAEAARARLAREGKALGYGVHANGTSDWDGTRDSFAQFVPGIATTRDYGVFADVAAFYAAPGPRWNRRTLMLRLFFPAAADAANAAAERLRAEGLGASAL
ncbi:MAG: hypothetical protein GC199_02275 [Alphaproteobacteria bacterium]|nr:hypothetical protein [Alphaproteobacteria bacterium]